MSLRKQDLAVLPPACSLLLQSSFTFVCSTEVEEKRAVIMGEGVSRACFSGPSGNNSGRELQFERLTRELEVERQIVANQLERCRVGTESPGAGSSRNSSLTPRSNVFPDASASGDTKSRMTDSSQSPSYRIRTESEQVSLYSPEQSSLHESEESTGNSHSSTQMNSYSDSGYQDASSGYLSSQNVGGKAELRMQHSFPGTGTGTLMRNARAEGQVSAVPGRAMRRVSSVPSRSHSPAYASSISPSRGSLRTSAGSAYGSPIVTEPKPLSSIFSTTLPSTHRTTSPYQASAGMTAVPQHYSSTLPRSVLHNTDPYGPQSYDIYERMTRPDSLTGAQISYASQHSQLGQDLRSAMSPDRHIAPIYEERTFQGPLYRSPSHTQQGTLYRSASGVGSLQRTSSQRSAMTYQRNNYALNTTATYADPYRSAQYRPSDPNYTHQAVVMDDGATRSPSIDSIQKDPREFAWRDPELTEVIHMLQHHFPSVQANAAAYLQHLCFGDNRIKAEVCRLGGIKHLVDLLDHKALEVQRNSCGALRNLVYGKASDDNKIAVRNAGGIPALLRLLRKTVDAEVRELVTGVLWNLSSCDAVKMTIIRDALTTLTNTVIIPHSGWSSSTFDDDHKLKFHSSLVLRNTTGCLRNLSSAGEEARKQMRTCEGLVDSLLYVIKACVNTSDFDSKIVENCICTLRNLSYRLELEMPPSRLTGGQEPDGLLGSESPSKEVDSSCWGRKKKKKKKSLQEDTWDGVGPIPGFSKSPKGAETLWHPAVVKPYLTLLAESSNPATLEGAAGSLQNLSAGNWKFAAYIRAAVRKEKGLPILVELLRMDNDRVVCSVATALRNMALDVRNKELIGKYAMRDLVNRLPGGNTTLLSDETVAAICCTLHEVTSKNMENAKALADTGGIEKLVNITKGRGDRYSMKVVKAAAQVLNTLWQYRDLRAIYKKDGWNQNHFLTPVSTLERDRFKSQPTLPTSTVQMSPVNHPGSATSSPAMLGIKEHRDSIRDYQRAQSTMQFYNYQGDNTIHKKQYTGSGKPSSYYYSPTREEPRRVQPVYYTEDPGRRNYDTYRMYLQHPHGYDDPYLEEVITYPPTVDYNAQPHRLKSTANYVDFYASTRRPSYRAEQYPGSPDSWV
uniref:Plakophilin 4 n=1 Tax=Mastacembelus armatus TaxID=205130 RepID=A0A7N8X2N5_9TELE